MTKQLAVRNVLFFYLFSRVRKHPFLCYHQPLILIFWIGDTCTLHKIQEVQ